MSAITLDPAATALVLIDLQNGITAMGAHPHGAADVVARAAKLAKRFREVGAPVVLVNVAFPAGPAALRPEADAVMKLPDSMPQGWDSLMPELEAGANDICITKQQWGAFYGTGLDMQLRRRGVKTIVLGGIATNIGVESTARDAYELGYHQVIVEDACGSTVSKEMHDFAFKFIFPRLSRVRSTEDVLKALN
ncbi:MAG TPA: hydrolase [Burkholderiaceae bacterium]